MLHRASVRGADACGGAHSHRASWVACSLRHAKMAVMAGAARRRGTAGRAAYNHQHSDYSIQPAGGRATSAFKPVSPSSAVRLAARAAAPCPHSAGSVSRRYGARAGRGVGRCSAACASPAAVCFFRAASTMRRRVRAATWTGCSHDPSQRRRRWRARQAWSRAEGKGAGRHRPHLQGALSLLRDCARCGRLQRQVAGFLR